MTRARPLVLLSLLLAGCIVTQGPPARQTTPPPPPGGATTTPPPPPGGATTLTPPPPAGPGDASVTAPAPTTPVPTEGRVCLATADCPAGQTCQGAEGCGLAWRCAPARACTKDLVDYCTCDGREISGSSSCPPAPYAHRGSCGRHAAPPVGGPPSGAGAKACRTNADCGRDQMCTGAEGCDAVWTCQPARPCTLDLVPYCGCDGRTIKGSSSCPPARFASRGACPAAGAGKPPISGPLPGARPKVCTASSECPDGQSCQGGEGCDALWTCQPERPCTLDRRPFCGCDGKTVRGSSSCPPAKYAHRGECKGAALPPSGAVPTCRSSADCPSGQTCQGAEGCGNTWTCQAAKPCTRDLVPYCGCDGATVRGSSSCPPGPFAHRGACK